MNMNTKNRHMLSHSSQLDIVAKNSLVTFIKLLYSANLLSRSSELHSGHTPGLVTVTPSLHVARPIRGQYQTIRSKCQPIRGQYQTFRSPMTITPSM